MLKVENLQFRYPKESTFLLSDLHFEINDGEFLLVIGTSGSGKSTLLRCLKPELQPFGERTGKITYANESLEKLNSCDIGFVFQDPDDQMVMDKVWHELAFGLENMNMPVDQMKHRVAEIVQYFKLQEIYDCPVDQLSSGQKQIVNLAAAMAMNPKILLLDEPTSRLDPFMAKQFLQFLKEIHDDFHTTIIMVEHRFEEVLPLSQKILWLDQGKAAAFGVKEKVLEALIHQEHPLHLALPEYMKLTKTALLTDKWTAHTYIQDHHWKVNPFLPLAKRGIFLQIKELNLEYDRHRVLKDLSFDLCEGEFFCLLGANGSGKSTFLRHLAFAFGRKSSIYYKHTPIDKAMNKKIVLLPQNPQVLFAHDTVEEELSGLERVEVIDQWLKQFHLDGQRHQHPYDLSGGQQQLLALIKLLLLKPKLLLLDEPTNGIDASMKQVLGEILTDLKQQGITILCVSHDLEFCAAFADRCGLLFDGKIEAVEATREFFKNNLFYTTSLGRLFRWLNPRILLAKDVTEDE
ncbi:ABC transporter ATP-binding protein [Beduini massiliensis]|uniref:ABC transporter ATP-binding protein n=1 Tax=Beduini massiliensis TaxID=1585974 RepID=UPI00059A85C6|nr:ABC transporter ATP-binding protein [Beduini massiliensis]